MRSFRQLFRCPVWIVLLLSTCTFMVTPNLVPAQSSGPTVDVCSSGMADSANDVEETVCLSGDGSQLLGYVEVDDGGYGYTMDFIPEVGADAQIFDGSRLVSDSGEPGSDYASTYVANPNLNDTYSLWGWLNECYDPSGMDNFNNCYWNYGVGSQSVQVQVTDQPALPVLAIGPVPLTSQQIQAVQSMTPNQIQQYLNDVQPAIASLRAQAAEAQQPLTLANWQDLISGAAAVSWDQSDTVSSSPLTFANPSTGTKLTVQPVTVRAPRGGGPYCPVWGCGRCPPTICFYPSGGYNNPDSDQDGLPDSFESQVANNFTPYYFSSAGEQDQFAIFGDYVPMTVTSLVGTVPPFSYYRVQPLGLATDPNDNQVFALRIDYLTLWNADDGLVGGGPACLYSYVGLDQVVQDLSGHDLDVERSGMLVAAPAVSGGYNPDPTAYSIYTVYTAAHEGTFFDQSAYASFWPAVPAGYHLNLTLSLSKHSTYVFDPDYYPITPAWFIGDYNQTLLELWLDGAITDEEYWLSMSIGNDVFFGCLVERFSDQGGSFANQRLNVGEPNHPMAGGGFIQGDSAHALYIYDKLNNPLF